jgi:hypothetical protein
VPNWLPFNAGVLSVLLGCFLTYSANATANHTNSEAVSRHADRAIGASGASQEGWKQSLGDAQLESANLFLAQYGPEGTARAARESLIEAARPDLRIFLAIGAVILLLRVLRSRERIRVETEATSNMGSGNQSNRSAAEDVKDFRAA